MNIIITRNRILVKISVTDRTDMSFTINVYNKIAFFGFCFKTIPAHPITDTIHIYIYYSKFAKDHLFNVMSTLLW